jgi:peptide/nickel transport system substrate-binding protein
MLGELWFNERAGLPGSDERVRQALAQAMDLRQLTAVVTGGTGEPATSLVPPGVTPCEKDTFSASLPAFDVAAARSALDAAGWMAGSDGVRARNGTPLALTLYFSTEVGPTMQAAAELIRGFWNEVGVDTTLRAATTAEINQAVISGEGSWDAVIAPLNVAVPSELVSFFSGPTPPGGTNFAGIDNPEYLAAVERASAIPGTDSCAEWAAAEVALVERADIVPFAFSNRPTFGNGATFELSDGGLVPTSVRMLG